VTTSPAGTARASAGVLGMNGTTTLFGSGLSNTQARSGVRIDAGCWFDPAGESGVEFGAFTLESAGASFFASSAGQPILARPFTDATTGNATASLIAFPGVSSGSILASDSGRNFLGFNADFRQNVTKSPWCRIDVLMGYQFLRYDERLRIAETALPTSAPFVAGTTVQSTDDFSTENIFHGLDLGLRTEFRYEALSLELLGKVAVGHVSRNVGIVGAQVVVVPGAAPAFNEGGLLALSSNIGSHKTTTWTSAPQLGVNLGWQVNPNVRVYTGYSVLWWVSVARPGEQVDLEINPGLVPPATGAAAGSPTRPAFLAQTSGLWVQALDLGVEVKY
jgi:hypothetical protein